MINDYRNRWQFVFSQLIDAVIVNVQHSTFTYSNCKKQQTSILGIWYRPKCVTEYLKLSDPSRQHQMSGQICLIAYLYLLYNHTFDFNQHLDNFTWAMFLYLQLRYNIKIIIQTFYRIPCPATGSRMVFKTTILSTRCTFSHESFVSNWHILKTNFGQTKFWTFLCRKMWHRRHSNN